MTKAVSHPRSRDMQPMVQVAVALLNVLWMVFFLQPHPFSVFVQRRSSVGSDDETLLGEFCVEPQSHMSWTSTPHSVTATATAENEPNSTTQTTPEANTEIGFTLEEYPWPEEMLPPQPSEIDLRPAPGGNEPHIIDLDRTTPAPPPAQTPTTSALGPARSSEAAAVSDAYRPMCLNCAPRVSSMIPCCFKFYTGRIPWRRIKAYFQVSPPLCPMKAIVLITVKKRKLCVDPSDVWVRNILKNTRPLHYVGQ